tara:strand:+ start:196 stop:483 length:288 start_codon:yes stop_codon:yes gene_type:complete
MYAALYFFVNFEGFDESNKAKFPTNILKLVLLTILPVFSFFKIKKNLKRLNNDKFQKAFGTLYGNHNTRKSTIIYSMPIFCIKRMLIALGTIFIL